MKKLDKKKGHVVEFEPMQAGLRNCVASTIIVLPNFNNKDVIRSDVCDIVMTAIIAKKVG